MPSHLRAPIYGEYVSALDRATAQLLAVAGSITAEERPRSLSGFRRWLYGILFGTVWFNISGSWYSSGFGLGRYSGRILAELRRLRGKKD
jgi:hypothetical protein